MFNIPASATIASVVSLFLSQFPFVSTWFGGLTQRQKVVTVLAINIVAGVGLFVHDNPGVLVAAFTFELIIALATNIIVAIGTSQIWHQVVNAPLNAGKSDS